MDLRRESKNLKKGVAPDPDGLVLPHPRRGDGGVVIFLEHGNQANRTSPARARGQDNRTSPARARGQDNRTSPARARGAQVTSSHSLNRTRKTPRATQVLPEEEEEKEEKKEEKEKEKEEEKEEDKEDGKEEEIDEEIGVVVISVRLHGTTQTFTADPNQKVDEWCTNFLRKNKSCRGGSIFYVVGEGASRTKLAIARKTFGEALKANAEGGELWFMEFIMAYDWSKFNWRTYDLRRMKKPFLRQICHIMACSFVVGSLFDRLTASTETEKRVAMGTLYGSVVAEFVAWIKLESHGHMIRDLEKFWYSDTFYPVTALHIIIFLGLVFAVIYGV